MFTIPHLPSVTNSDALADFAEIKCWLEGQISSNSLVSALGLESDNADHDFDGIEDEEDELHEAFDDAVAIIESRSDACGNGYPFCVEQEGYVVSHRSDVGNDPRAAIYTYLLLSTRINMGLHRTQGGIDGTKTFESLSPHILASYLGKCTTESLVFGTAEQGKLKDKVNHLCKSLGEGRGYIDRDEDGDDANDDGLDTVAWKPFADGRAGKLILFTQCKTGTSWRPDAARLRPDAFVDRWFLDPPLFRPIRAYCVAEAVAQHEWNKQARVAGLLFDRCRIVSLSSSVPENLLKQIRSWTEAARSHVSKYYS